MNRDNNHVVFEIPALAQIQKRLDGIDNKLEKLASIIKTKDDDTLGKVSEKKMMNLNELSEAYGMSIWSLRYRASRREIPLVKIGRRLYVNIEDFEEWLTEKKINIVK